MKLLLVAAILGLGGAALAQNYGGVVPGSPTHEKHKAARKGPNLVTWVGFTKEGDAARVFLRVSSAVQPEQAVAGDQLTVTLPGFKIDTKNNGRPLNTKYFGTDVVRVHAVETKTGVEVRVTFAKMATQARVTTAAAQDDVGGTLVYLDFSAAS
jgi:hypothetical protein